ncbi:MAG: hypothetical protein KF819_40080 [Labilithrix sp.]|nr:hypothetical protein [Labilithrix sp.]
MNRTFTAFAFVSALAAAACDKSGTEAQEKANRAQAEANEDINRANAESTTKITNAQVEADKKIAEAQNSFATTVEDYRHTMQGRLDDLDKKLVDLDAKSRKATGQTKAKIDTNLPKLRVQRDAFVSDFKAIDTATASTWDATRARLDKEWNDLKTAVDKVD